MSSTPADLLRRAIAASGLSARQYATTVLLRDERTVRRWLSGDSPIPAAVVEFLERTALVCTCMRGGAPDEWHSRDCAAYLPVAR